MIEELTANWLVDQHVPLYAFIIALLTSPAYWSRRVTGYLAERFTPVQEQNGEE